MEQQAQQHEGEQPARPPKPPVAREAYTVAEFCEAFRISRSFFYDEIRRGAGPKTYKSGKNRFVSVEAAKEWRVRMEAAA